MLNLILLLLSVGTSVGLVVGISSLSAWWLFGMIPLGYILATALYFILLFATVPFLPRGKEGERSSRFCRFIIWLSSDWLMVLLRIRVRVPGLKLPDEPMVLVSNHRSDFDPMVVLQKTRKRNLIYISKESNFKFPLVGPYLRGAGYYAIDRENAMRALRTLKSAAERMKAEGLDIGIYPEGTRSKTGELLEFKTGAFYLAKKANAPVVVMTTEGTEIISRNFPWKGAKVHLHVAEIISREEVAAMTTEALAERVRNTIAENLSQNR